MSRLLPNWIRAYLQYTDNTESPDAYHFWSAVALLASATKRRVCANLNFWKIFPNHYIILVGPSGAKKSSGLDLASGLADEAGIKRFSDKLTAAALIKDLSEVQEKFIKEGSPEIEIISPLLIYSSELGVFMGPDAYGSGLIGDLTDLYDCGGRLGKWEKKTIGRGTETILGPFVNLLGASTPQTIKDVIPAPSVGQGFTSRILFVWGGGRRKRVPIPEFHPEHKELERKLINDLKEISNLSGEFKFSSRGLELYIKHYNERPEPEDEYEDERLRGYSSRKDIHILKLSMVLSLSGGNSLLITEREVAGAIEAINFLDKGFPNVFSSQGASATAEDVTRIFRQIEVDTKKEGFARHSVIIRRNYHNLNLQETEMVIKMLIQGGAITEEYHQSAKGMVKCYKAIDGGFLTNIKRG